MGTSGSTFEIVRMPASYIISLSGHGKWAKTVLFAFLPITQMQKFSRGIRGCQMKADVLEIPKMW